MSLFGFTPLRTQRSAEEYRPKELNKNFSAYSAVTFGDVPRLNADG
jgi:hypothetical protein